MISIQLCLEPPMTEKDPAAARNTSTAYYEGILMPTSGKASTPWGDSSVNIILTIFQLPSSKLPSAERNCEISFDLSLFL
jgi:hypothetical protein